MSDRPVMGCKGGSEVGVSWDEGLVLHSNDEEWHPWDESVFGPLPITPGAYWRPDISLSEVWTLGHDGSWHHNLTGEYVSTDDLPGGLTLLGKLNEQEES